MEYMIKTLKVIIDQKLFLTFREKYLWGKGKTCFEGKDKLFAKSLRIKRNSCLY